MSSASTGIKKAFLHLLGIMLLLFGICIPAMALVAPINTSLSPNSGSIPYYGKHTFTTVHSDGDGYSDLSACMFLIRPDQTLSESGAAYVGYDVGGNGLYVYDDATDEWIGGDSPGSSVVLESNYCKLYCAETTVSGSGNNLTINWKIEFKSNMVGTSCGAWMWTTDNEYNEDYLEQMGTFSIYGDSTAPITPVVTDEGSCALTLQNSLSASWSSSDPETGIAAYKYRIVNDTNAVIQDWQEVSDSTTNATVSSLTLSLGSTYYFQVQAKNGNGDWSATGTSSGVSVNQAPINPSFEDGFYTSGNDHVPNNWHKFIISGTPHFSYDSGHTYNNSVDIYGPNCTAGLYQQISCAEVGKLYTVNAWVACYKNDYDPDINYWIGIDPYGGTDPTSSNVSWCNTVSNGRPWRKIFHSVESQASTITIFVKAQNTSNSQDEMLIDDFTLLIDSTAPSTPVVTDSGTIDASDSVSLSGSWDSSDDQSGIVEYEYAVGTSPSDEGRYTIGWTSAGDNQTVTLNNSSLKRGIKYYFYVKARNSANMWSNIGYSDGVIVSPAKPVVSNARISDLNNSTLKADFSCSSNNVAEYIFALGTTATDNGTYVIPWTSNGTSTSLSLQSLSLPPTSTYYLYVKAKNTDNQWSYATSAQVQVKLDLLLGLGDFSQSTFTRRYPANASDPEVIESVTGRQVADGWRYMLNDPTEDADVSLDLDTVDSLDCQKIKLQGSNADVYFMSIIYVDTTGTDPYKPHPGDDITLSIDRIDAVDWNGSGIYSHLDRYFWAENGSQFYSGSAILISPNVSTSPYTINPAPLTVTIPTTNTPTRIRAGIRFYCGELQNGHEPTIKITGAHVYVKHNGDSEYAFEYVPVLKDRNIKTNAILGMKGERYVANNCDEYCTGIYSYANWDIDKGPERVIPILRKLNPNMKIYLYQALGSAFFQYYTHVSEDLRWIPGSSPLRVQDIDNLGYTSWLYPQTVPATSYDPASWNTSDTYYANLVATYQNTGGYPYKFLVDLTNSDCRNTLIDKAILKAQKYGVDGFWMDDTGVTERYDTVHPRTKVQCQQFTHAVIPMVKSAGFTTFSGGAETNLVGENWEHDLAALHFNPTWEPNTTYPESAGYSANTVENTGDIFYQESSFIRNTVLNAPLRFDAEYWLKCLNDADILVDWNEAANLTGENAKRFQYGVELPDTTSDDGVDGWIQFTLASYLLCQNEFTSFGINYSTDGNYLPPDIDYSIIKKLGEPDGANTAIGSNPYFRYRKYKPTSVDETGGIVVVNGDRTCGGTSTSHTYTPTVNLIEVGTSNVYGPEGTASITLSPGTARIFYYKYPNP